MSSNPNITISTWFQQPPEILLEILKSMNPSDRIKIATAYPEVFLRPGFNVFAIDASDQLKRQRHHTDPTNPIYYSRSQRPLVYVAIDDRMEPSVIENILRAYTDVCPTAIDGVFGKSNITLPPPLHYATVLGRPQAVSLLLKLGADPLLRVGPHAYRPNATVGPAGTNTMSAMEAAIGRGIELRLQGINFLLGPNPDDQEHREIEECAMTLYQAGVPIPRGGRNVWLNRAFTQVEKPWAEQIYYPIRAGFLRVLSAILDPVVPFNQGKPSFLAILYSGLIYAIMYQNSDDVRDIIEYLVGLGGLNKEIFEMGVDLEDDTREFLDQTIAHTASNHRYPKTAAYLVNQFINEGVKFPFEYATFGLHKSIDLITLVQALYNAIMVKGGLLRGRPVSRQVLLEFLLKRVIECEDDASMEWLANQGVEPLLNFHYAIVQGNDEAVYNLVNAGISLDKETTTIMESSLLLHGINVPSTLPPTETPPETPLTLALRLGRYRTACFLIYHNADPKQVPNHVKQELLQAYQTTYNQAYGSDTQNLLPSMLQPEYFSTFDNDRLFAMFYYVIGLPGSS